MTTQADETQKLRIKNFKSIVDLELVNPSPFSVFVGPNGAGKSNIFEALDLCANYPVDDWARFWGRREELLNYKSKEDTFSISHSIENIGSFHSDFQYTDTGSTNHHYLGEEFNHLDSNNSFDNFWLSRFSRLFIGKDRLLILNYQDDKTISLSARNLEKVLKRLLYQKDTYENIIEWLQLLIPEFDKLQIYSDTISGDDSILVYEQYANKPFKKSLISDGTFNIIALLTAVFQSDKPQFLCIEEPENGLNPKVIRTLVEFFREACEDKGHYIWLNTHSQTLISQLREEEMILVNKEQGETKVRQLKTGDFYGLSADEALLTNTLGGGIPW